MSSHTGTDNCSLHRCTTAFCTAASAVAAVGVILVTATTSALASSAESPGSRARPPGQATRDAAPPPSAAHTAARPSSTCRTPGRSHIRSRRRGRGAPWPPAPRAGCCHAAGPCPPAPGPSSWPHPSGPPHEPPPRCPPGREASASVTGPAGYRCRGSPHSAARPLRHLHPWLSLQHLRVQPQVHRLRRADRSDDTEHLTRHGVFQFVTALHVLIRVAVHRLRQLRLPLLWADLGPRHHPLQRRGLRHTHIQHTHLDALFVQAARSVADSFCPVVVDGPVPQVTQHNGLLGVGLVVGVHHIRRQTAPHRHLVPLLPGPRADLRRRRPRTLLRRRLDGGRLRSGGRLLQVALGDLVLQALLELRAQLRLDPTPLGLTPLMLQLPQSLTRHRLVRRPPPPRPDQPRQQTTPLVRSE